MVGKYLDQDKIIKKVGMTFENQQCTLIWTPLIWSISILEPQTLPIYAGGAIKTYSVVLY